MKQLERLLFLQGGRCFFCAQSIPSGEASVEHLVASANGGAKDDENCVVCCKTVNAALGSLSIKAKIQAVLNQRGLFACPAAADVSDTQRLPQSHLNGEFAKTQADRLVLVLADLRKRAAAKPRRVATLKNTIKSVFHMQLEDVDVDALLSLMQANGHIEVKDMKVTYNLPAEAAA